MVETDEVIEKRGVLRDLETHFLDLTVSLLSDDPKSAAHLSQQQRDQILIERKVIERLASQARIDYIKSR